MQNKYLFVHTQVFQIVDCGPHAPQTRADMLKPLFCCLCVLKTKWLPYSLHSFKAPGAPQLHSSKEMMCTPKCKVDGVMMQKWVNYSRIVGEFNEETIHL